MPCQSSQPAADSRSTMAPLGIPAHGKFCQVRRQGIKRSPYHVAITGSTAFQQVLRVHRGHRLRTIWVAVAGVTSQLTQVAVTFPNPGWRVMHQQNSGVSRFRITKATLFLKLSGTPLTAIFCPREELLLTNPVQQGEGDDNFNWYQMFSSVLPALTSLTQHPHMLPDAPCCPRGKWKLRLVQGCLELLYGCDREWDCLPTATAAVQEQLEHCAALAQRQC